MKAVSADGFADSPAKDTTKMKLNKVFRLLPGIAYQSSQWVYNNMLPNHDKKFFRQADTENYIASTKKKKKILKLYIITKTDDQVSKILTFLGAFHI